MSFPPTQQSTTSDVEQVRIILGNVGKQNIQLIEDDECLAVGTNTLYLNFNDILNIIGVWSGSDYDHSNPITFTGSFHRKKGVLLTSNTPFIHGNTYLVNYYISSGLQDEDITRALIDAENDIRLNLWIKPSETINLNSADVVGSLTLSLKLNIAAKLSLQTMNMGNIIQSGYNYRFQDASVETKLFGEGMGTEVLLEELKTRIDNLYEMLKLYYHTNLSIIRAFERVQGNRYPLKTFNLIGYSYDTRTPLMYRYS
jgi:hypothetical protein